MCNISKIVYIMNHLTCTTHNDSTCDYLHAFMCHKNKYSVCSIGYLCPTIDLYSGHINVHMLATHPDILDTYGGSPASKSVPAQSVEISRVTTTSRQTDGSYTETVSETAKFTGDATSFGVQALVAMAVPRSSPVIPKLPPAKPLEELKVTLIDTQISGQFVQGFTWMTKSDKDAKKPLPDFAKTMKDHKKLDVMLGCIWTYKVQTPFAVENDDVLHGIRCGARKPSGKQVCDKHADVYAKWQSSLERQKAERQKNMAGKSKPKLPSSSSSGTL